MVEQPDQSGSRQSVLLIGQGRLVDVARRTLDDAGAEVTYLRDPTDRQIRRALGPEVDAVMVISRDDRASLRFALVIEGLREGVRLIVTIYNRDLGALYRIGGTLLAVAALGSPADEAFVAQDTIWVIGPEARIEPVDVHLRAVSRPQRSAGSAGGGVAEV